MRARLPALAAALPLLAPVACAPAGEPVPASSAAARCTDGELPTRTAGTSTVATDAVADRLGHARDAVQWVSASSTSAVAPGAKTLDADANQVPTTGERRETADPSTGCHDVARAVVDLPTALHVTAAELDGATVVGLLPAGRALTPCVSQDVDALRADGTLVRLQEQGLTSAAVLPRASPRGPGPPHRCSSTGTAAGAPAASAPRSSRRAAPSSSGSCPSSR